MGNLKPVFSCCKVFLLPNTNHSVELWAVGSPSTQTTSCTSLIWDLIKTYKNASIHNVGWQEEKS